MKESSTVNRSTFATFFVNRPVFAWVLALLVMLAGTISLFSLPVSQYPSIAPPSISVIATYPGASAKTIEESVTQVIENKMKGLDLESTCKCNTFKENDSNANISTPKPRRKSVNYVDARTTI